MYRRLRLFSIIIITLLIPISSFSATIHVPTDQPTIQGGIDVAVDSDVDTISFERINTSVIHGNYAPLPSSDRAKFIENLIPNGNSNSDPLDCLWLEYY